MFNGFEAGVSKTLVEAQEELNRAVRELGRDVFAAVRPVLEWIDRRLEDVVVGLGILRDRARFRA